jgi:hypothetical protein
MIDRSNATKMRHQRVGKRRTANLQDGLFKAIHRGIEPQFRPPSGNIVRTAGHNGFLHSLFFNLGQPQSG